MPENQSQWPAQDPRYGPPDSAPAPPVGPPVPAPGHQAPPAGYPVPVPGYQMPPTPYQVPPGYPVQQPGHQVPPGYPVQQAGHQVPPGYPVQQVGHQVRLNPSMRASSADRERAVDVLKAGFAEGRLTQEEYNDRMGRAYAARTYGELAALTSDLPIGPLPFWPGPVHQAPAGTNSMAIASMVLGVAEFFTMGLTAIPAVICGHVARRQMKMTAERGEGLATSGLVLGYMAIIFWAVLIAATLVGMAMSISRGQTSFPNGPGG